MGSQRGDRGKPLVVFGCLGNLRGHGNPGGAVFSDEWMMHPKSQIFLSEERSFQQSCTIASYSFSR
ncbi:MAG: hypothetical protein RLZZ435_2017 [Cyanobacteriota bacterium]|jgi:hypothetical protein